ncbi:hypothetical protein [Pseudomonas phage vB_Pae_CF23a]|nr:hypothetical protein [Pseudomonas phage vB_Pae_CF23a]QBI80073.1 hypothetical protein [Pseudomonas phage vB_Pae_CF57a]QBI80162.1 hypothetical protein [Pseudomonas phage vB_Pae_CF65a]QBI80299.1 hypothetical protein [Pseudomonas phage vB_Pae_CF81a]QBI80386.1 hypothetical protein [Pseudomonas phage vB_Pae_CF118a]QBI80636.1 hypothetical protein [Pseudomonas phage vB_Pae_CF177c]QBI80723.1 hypothetical protein [Pseudomonas phage vB_Pae_CF213a]
MNSRPRHASRAIVKTSRVSDRSLCKKKHPDFSDALRKRGIEEVNEHQPYGCIGEWSECAGRCAMGRG